MKINLWRCLFRIITGICIQGLLSCNAHTYYPASMNVPMLDTAAEVNLRVGQSNFHGAISLTKNLFITGSVQYKNRNGRSPFEGDFRSETNSNKTNLAEYGLGYMTSFKIDTYEAVKLSLQGGYGTGNLHYWRHVTRPNGYMTYYSYDLEASLKKVFGQASLSVSAGENVLVGAAIQYNNLTYDRLRIKGDSLGGVANQQPNDEDIRNANPDWSKRQNINLRNMEFAVFARANLMQIYGMVQVGYSNCFNYSTYSSAQFNRVWLEISVGIHFGLFREPYVHW